MITKIVPQGPNAIQVYGTSNTTQHEIGNDSGFYTPQRTAAENQCPFNAPFLVR